MMNQDCSHAYNLFLSDIGMPVAESGSGRSSGFTQNLQMMNNPCLKQFVPFKGITPLGGMTFDPFDRLKHIV